MAGRKPQTFANHARFVPLYHVVAFGIFAINFFYALYRLIVAPAFGTVMAFLVSIALVLLFVFTRMFAVTVQDRVIRLEMRLRLRELLPADLARRAQALTTKQLIALRFASDAELPALCARVLDGDIQDQKTIKQMVKDWQADYLRA